MSRKEYQKCTVCVIDLSLCDVIRTSGGQLDEDELPGVSVQSKISGWNSFVE